MSEQSKAAPRPAAEKKSLQTLTRGLAVLDFVAQGSGTVSAKAIAAELGLRTGTVYHIIRTLRSSGHIRRIAGGTYDIGPEGARLGRHLEERTAPSPEISAILSRLHHRTGENAFVNGWYHGIIMMQHAIRGTKALAVRDLEVGLTGTYHARASCKAILAFMPRDHVRAMFDGLELEALTEHTITNFDDLVAQLAAIEKQGFALDLEEYAEGVACVSAPFFDDSGRPIGSFSVNLPTSRFAEEQAALIAAVGEAASIATNMYRNHRLVLPSQSSPELPTTSRRRSASDALAKEGTSE